MAVLLCLGLALIWAGAAAQSLPEGDGSKAQQESPGDKPASQGFNFKSGKVTAQGNLGAGGASGALSLRDWSNAWFFETGFSTGMLNDELSFGLSLDGAWSPRDDLGLWLKLKGESASGYFSYGQATLNLGCRAMPGIKLLGTLDLLSKRLEVQAWDKDEWHNQYGAGLALDYTLLPGLDLAGFFSHYHTEGKEYGLVGEYEYIDDDNWQHYGFIYGGVRGGDYDEAGLRASYRHPLGLHFGLGLSQIWRSYEEMLGHAAKDEDNAAARASLGWRNIMDSGVNFNAQASMEFASSDRLSWQAGLNRRLGPVDFRLTYSEMHNDRFDTDRRIYAGVSLPLDDIGSALKAVAKSVKDLNRKKPYRGAWLRQPVSGMGNPALKVSQQLEQRVDETSVDLSMLAEGVSVSKTTMTISGLPALCCLDTEFTTPASAQGAFSIGGGGTSVLVDLTKLPKPEYIQAVFQQQDGLYTLIVFSTEAGSTMVKNQGQISNISQPTLEYLEQYISHLKSDPSFYISVNYPPDTIYIGETVTVSVKANDINNIDNEDIPFRSYWAVSGAGGVVGRWDNKTVKIKGLREGLIYVNCYGFDERPEGKSKGYYSARIFAINVKKRPPETTTDGGDDTGGGDDDSGDDDSGSEDPGSGGSCGDFEREGVWTITDSSGFTLKVRFNAANLIVWVDNGRGQTLSSDDISEETGGCSDGKYVGSFTCKIDGVTYSYDLNLDISGKDINSGSTVTEYINYLANGTYNVTGSHAD